MSEAGTIPHRSTIQIMTTNELREHLPKVTSVLGENWLKKHDWAQEYISPRITWYEQTEADLAVLEPFLGLQRLMSCYRKPLRDRSQTLKAIFEIHGAAFMSVTASRVDLHVQRGAGSGRNFDVRVEIDGHVVNADSKTRKDEFPFNLPRKTDASNVASHAGARATVDPHDATDLGLLIQRPAISNYIETPESTVIRQLLLDGLAQLPELGCNLIIFGHIEGDRRSLEDALFGAEFVGIKKNLETRQFTAEWLRSPTGAFGRGPEGDAFRGLSAVLWVRLFKASEGTLFRAYTLCLNLHANICIPNGVQTAIEKVAKNWEKLPSKSI